MLLQNEIYSLRKKRKNFLFGSKKKIFQKNKQKTLTKVSNCFEKVNQKNWLLGGNFCKILGKCG
jgi:hypothetical protein